MNTNKQIGADSLNYIITSVKKLTKKYKTNDPFFLCNLLDINLTITTLPPHIKGIFTTFFEMPFIFLSDQLDDCDKRAVCAHELAHAVLHPNTNTLYVQNNTFLSTTKFEKEADFFAAHLLIDDATPFGDNLSAKQLAFEYNVPIEYIQIKYGYMKS